MNSFAWWPTVLVLLVAVVIDIGWRRIPNWLSLPFLVAGIGVNAFRDGFSGFERSIAGLGFAIAVTGVLCYMRGMGLGDMKLMAGVGAWIGPGQLVLALVATGIAGGLLAVAYALKHRSLSRCLDSTADLIAGLPKQGWGPHATIAMSNAAALKMPYAPAIAIGTIFSFFSL